MALNVTVLSVRVVLATWLPGHLFLLLRRGGRQGIVIQGSAIHDGADIYTLHYLQHPLAACLLGDDRGTRVTSPSYYLLYASLYPSSVPCLCVRGWRHVRHYICCLAKTNVMTRRLPTLPYSRLLFPIANLSPILSLP